MQYEKGKTQLQTPRALPSKQAKIRNNTNKKLQEKQLKHQHATHKSCAEESSLEVVEA